MKYLVNLVLSVNVFFAAPVMAGSTQSDNRVTDEEFDRFIQSKDL